MSAAAGEGAADFLAHLELDDREAVRSRAGPRRFRTGAILMHEGQLGNEVMIIVSGRVKVTYATAEGREVVLGFCGPGELLGELSVMDGTPRSSTVEAIEPVETLAISAADFRSLVKAREGLANQLVVSMARRLRNADRKRIEFAASQALGRVSARLIEMAERYGEDSGEGIVIDLPITQEELAGWTASSREAVAKALHSLRDLGLIATERRRITVLDLEGLAKQSA